MGCGSSSTSGAVLDPKAGGSAPAQAPYNGSPVEYHFVNTQVTMSVKPFAFAEGSEMTSSDVDSYYPFISAKMAEGYHLVVYRMVPGQMKMDFTSLTSAKMPYQGIFLRSRDEELTPYTLVIEKTGIQPTRVKGGIIPFSGQEVKTETSHLFSSIAKHTQNGGRLIAIGMNGQATSSGLGSMLSGKSAICGVDLFFEIPTKPRGNFVYQTVSVPVQMSTKVGLGMPTTTVNCDWIGNFNTPLSQGWRLVNIFMDASSNMQMQGLTSTNMTMNTIWFFEKPEDIVSDTTQRYEGTMVEFIYKVSVGLGGSKSSIAWEPKVAEMGQQGWELASILDYPGIVGGAGFGTANLKLLMFFQRKIVR